MGFASRLLVDLIAKQLQTAKLRDQDCKDTARSPDSWLSAPGPGPGAESHASA